MWVSTRVGRGTYVSVGGGLSSMLVIGALFGGLLRLSIAVVGFVVVLITVPLLAYLIEKNNNKRFLKAIETLMARASDPASIASDGKYTQPRTWGVYEVERLVRGVRAPYWHFGNHPVRQEELIREYGHARLVGLFTSRADAEELRYVLNSKVLAAVTGKQGMEA